jgi:hypothetical protein
VDVIKGDPVSQAERVPQGVRLHSPGLQDSPDADVTRNDRVRDPGQLSVEEMDIGAADFAGHRLQKD